MKWPPKKLSEGPVKNILTMLSSSSVSQVVPFITAPILTRIYSPIEFGIYEIFFSIITFISVIPNLRMENVVLIEKDNRLAFNVLNVLVIFNLLFLIVFVILVFLLKDVIKQSFDFNINPLWFVFIPLTAISASLYNLFTQWFVRNSAYKHLARLRIFLTIFNASVQIALGLIFQNFVGLILGGFVSYLAIVLLMFILFRKSVRVDNSLSIDLKQGWRCFKENRAFLIYTLPSDLVNSFAAQLPTILIARYFPPAILGYFGMSRRIIGLPLAFVSGAIRDVFNKEISTENNTTGKTIKSFLMTLKVLLPLGLGIILGVYLLGDFVIIGYLGKDWINGLFFIKILAISFVFKFIAGTLNFVFLVKNKQRADLIWQIFGLATVFLTFYCTHLLEYSPEKTFVVYVISISIFYLLNLLKSYQYANR